MQLKASERFVRAAIEAGLLDIEIGEDDLLKAFRDLAGRFHVCTAKSNTTDTNKARSEHQIPDGTEMGHDE